MRSFIPVVYSEVGKNECSLQFEPLITVRDFASFLQVTEQTVRDMVHRGELPGVRINRRIYIQRDEFFEQLKRGDYCAKA